VFTADMKKDLVTGILMSWLAVTVSAWVPIVGLIGSAFIPVPIIFYRAKTGTQAARVIALATLGYVLLLGGRLELLFFGELLLIGVLMGELMARRWPLEAMAAGVCVAVLGAGLAGIWVFGLFSGKGLVETISEGVRRNLELTLQLYREMGLPQDQLSFLESSLDMIQQVMVGLMPALVIGSTLVTVWVCLLTVRQVCLRRGLPTPDYGALDHWKAPEMLVWGVIASGVLLLLPGLVPKMLGLNGLLGFMVIYFFQGIAIVAYFFRKKQVPRVARVVLYGLIAIQQLVMLAVVGVGFFDTWFNFRKIEKPLAPG
jgi:uncharacterized protein YybS (DUF2232 family)